MRTYRNYVNHVEANLVCGHSEKASRLETSNYVTIMLKFMSVIY